MSHLRNSNGKFKEVGRVRRSKMSYSLQNLVLITLLLLSTASRTIEASGVFELELLKLDQLDVDQSDSTPNTANRTAEQQVTTDHTQKTAKLPQEDPTKLVQLFVCLKEAFTSQLDGPCTFGNASITLYKDSLLSQHKPSLLTSPLRDSANQDQTNRQQNSSSQQQQQQQQGSLMTNVVRILFTFRWTKSFTIILTAEQLQQNEQQPHTDNLHQQLNQSRRATQLVAVRNGLRINGSLLESSLSAALPANRSTGGRENGQQVNRLQFIDRHVLTENEVLPNLEPNQNKPWVSRFSRSLKSSLAYRFRVYCSLHYYGDGCTNFCRPREDQFGHYNCSSHGQKVCHEGWMGPDCDRAQCRSGCNLQHGYCDKPDTCQCRSGWTGSRCDQCITYPGCQNGYCLSPWQCICQRNWGGVFCDQDLDQCGARQPCKNNGTCQNIAPGKYKCHCPDGFTGVDCDINLNLTSSSNAILSGTHIHNSDCTVNPCLNGGTCYGFNALLVDSSYAVSLIANSTGGSQSANRDTEHRSYRCQCPAGYNGDYCQWPDLASQPIISLLNETSTEEQSEPINDHSDPPESVSQPIYTESSFDTAQRQEVEVDKSQTIFTTFVESAPPSTQHIDIRHLISWVVIASIIGVFLASLLLAWCCLIAIEKNGLSFIQMNIIRTEDRDGGSRQPAVANTLRRMHEKIRDSFRRSSRCRIKPETKLSLENVLRPPKLPPPPYDEVGHHILADRIVVNLHEHLGKNSERGLQSSKFQEPSTTKGNLVIRGALEQKLSEVTSSPIKAKMSEYAVITNLDEARLNCPRHGHLYRQIKPPETQDATNFTMETSDNSRSFMHIPNKPR